jgi:hypothetical protein
VNTKAKGRKGHALTQELLSKLGWAVYVCPHTQVEWRTVGQGEKLPIWQTSGFNDAFSIPTGDGKKREGGFDIIALKAVEKPDGKLAQYFSLWQVKKTKANPLTPKLKSLICRCADAHHLPLSACYIIWWPDGVGINRGEPVIWRADGVNGTISN